MLDLLVVSIFVFVLIVVFTYALGGLLAAPWLPLWKDDVRRMLKLAKIKPGQKVFDLGAGDGRVLITAAEEFQAQAKGFEISILPYLLGCIKIYGKGLNRRIQFKYRNFYNEDISDADVICLFLTPGGMEKLKTKLEKETKKGCRILSYAFAIKGWVPIQTDKPKPESGTIYLYQR